MIYSDDHCVIGDWEMIQIGVRDTKVECNKPHGTGAGSMTLFIAVLVGPDAARGRLILTLRIDKIILVLVVISRSQRGNDNTKSLKQYNYHH